jgi:hypothetical protein
MKTNKLRQIFDEIQNQRKFQADEIRTKFQVKVAEPNWKDAFVTSVQLDAKREEIEDALKFFHGCSRLEVTEVFKNVFNVSSSGYLK